jgi:hypothetical protein
MAVHAYDTCSVSGATIPTALQGHGSPCPSCGNGMGFEFDGTARPDWDAAKLSVSLEQVRRPMWSYLVAAGVFVGVAVVFGVALAVLGGPTRALPVVVGGLGAWLYLHQTRNKDWARHTGRLHEPQR